MAQPVAITTNSSAVGPNLDNARQFLIALNGHEMAEFTAIGEGGAVRVFRGPVTDNWDDLSRLNLAGYGIYFTVSGTNGPRRKENVVSMRWIWADVDIKAFPSRDAAWQAVVAINDVAPASLIVKSGHGWHVYLKIEELTTPEEFARAERVMKSIAVKYGADIAVADRARIMRLAGTLNTKGQDWKLVTAKHDPAVELLSLDELSERFGEAGPTLSVIAGTSVLDEMPEYVQREIDKAQPAVNAALLGGLPVTTADDVRRVLAHVNPDVPYPDWRKAIGAIKSALNGSDESLEIAIAWSLGALIAPEHADVFTSAKFSGEDAVEAKWNGCAALPRPGDATLGTLVLWARENGFTGHVGGAEGVSATPPLLDRLTNPPGGPVSAMGAPLQGTASPFGPGTAVVPAPAVFPRLFRSAAEMLAAPPRVDWLVSGILPRGANAMLFGPSGAGKSFFALDVACAVATETQWHNHRVKGGPVLYLAGEGFNGLRLRLRAWQAVHGVDLTAAALHVSTTAVPFNAEGSALLKSALAEMPEPPTLIVVDTLARHLVGDENSQRDAAEFVQTCAALSTATGAAVLTVHHSGHAAQDRARGSSALRAAVDVEMALTGNPGGFDLAFTKIKDGKTPPPMTFSLREVELGLDEYHAPVTSAVPIFSGTAIPRPPHRPAARPEVADLVAEHPGLTTDELRPKWAAMGNPTRRLGEQLKRAIGPGFLRSDQDGKWWLV